MVTESTNLKQVDDLLLALYGNIDFRTEMRSEWCLSIRVYALPTIKTLNEACIKCNINPDSVIIDGMYGHLNLVICNMEH